MDGNENMIMLGHSRHHVKSGFPVSRRRKRLCARDGHPQQRLLSIEIGSTVLSVLCSRCGCDVKEDANAPQPSGGYWFTPDARGFVDEMIGRLQGHTPLRLRQ